MCPIAFSVDCCHLLSPVYGHELVYIDQPRRKDDCRLYDVEKDLAEMHGLMQVQTAIPHRLIRHPQRPEWFRLECSV